MPKRIDEDRKFFRDVIKGKFQQKLSKYIEDGQIFRMRGKNGKIAFPIKRINTPRFTYGSSKGGVGRGEGKDGDVIGRDPNAKAKGKGKKVGDGHEDGMQVQVELEYILQFLKEELGLPDLKPKDSDTYDQIRIKYNNISRTGPRSLRHMRRTFLKALQRQLASGVGENLKTVPGINKPIRLITPINDDFRYRQYTEIKEPANNAAILFARDSSYSMTDEKCEIVSDMCWWIDLWIQSFYKRTERAYFCHDVNAFETDRETFYKYRYGGGTKCSSVLELMAEQFKERFNPLKWNIYVLYFSDGENEVEDNPTFVNLLKTHFNPQIVNQFAFTQIMGTFGDSAYPSLKSVLSHVEMDNLSLAGIGDGKYRMGEDERNLEIRKAIQKHLGTKK